MFLNKPTVVPIRKFPGPLSHPLVAWPGFFVLFSGVAARSQNWLGDLFLTVRRPGLALPAALLPLGQARVHLRVIRLLAEQMIHRLLQAA